MSNDMKRWDYLESLITLGDGDVLRPDLQCFVPDDIELGISSKGTTIQGWHPCGCISVDVSDADKQDAEVYFEAEVSALKRMVAFFVNPISGF